LLRFPPVQRYNSCFLKPEERPITNNWEVVKSSLWTGAGGVIEDFIEVARICIAHSHVTASPEVAAELRRIAEEYRKKAADLEWENWPAGGEENVGEVLREG
jgi:hypothetical protein